jgi:hypothetical protein
MADGAEIELDVKLKLGGLDGPGGRVPGFPMPGPVPVQAAESSGQAPTQQAAEPRKPFQDYVAEKTPCQPVAEPKDRQAEVER